jgi:hypothetical protein
MSVNLAPKKTQYILNCIAQAAAAKAANDALVLLAAEWSNQFNTGQNAALVDADFQIGTGTAHMTAAQLSTFFSGFQTALASATSGNLQGLLAILPQ